MAYEQRGRVSLYRIPSLKYKDAKIAARWGEAMLKGLTIRRNGEQFLERPTGIVVSISMEILYASELNTRRGKRSDLRKGGS